MLGRDPSPAEVELAFRYVTQECDVDQPKAQSALPDGTEPNADGVPLPDPADNSGVAAKPKPLSPWAKLAQVLLQANERIIMQ